MRTYRARKCAQAADALEHDAHRDQALHCQRGCAFRSTNGRRLEIFRDVMLLGTCKHLTRDHSAFGVRVAECATLADTAKE